ncbi:ABC transporter permease protein [Lacticaseibacillus paracasei subsp. paracasei Lpp46]|nr:ABC transporter permease protein [Lacticaseibacillus paracasei subsp. paracasei Lpp46]
MIVLGCGLLVPVVFTMTPSNLAQAAMPGELFLPLLAIFAFGNLFSPEQTAEIGAVINSKQTQLWWLYLLRFIWYAMVLTVLATGLISVYGSLNAGLDLLLLWIDFMIKILLIGSVTVLSYSLSRSLAVTYLLPTAYFALCVGYRHLGAMTIMTFMRHRPMADNWIQLLLAGLFLTISFLNLKSRPVQG